MMKVERGAASLTLRFRRQRAEKIVAAITALVALQMTYFAVRTSLLTPQKQVSCERAHDLCMVTGADIFGRQYRYHFPASAMRRSHVVPGEHHEQKWVVEMAGGRADDIGALTGRRAQIAKYETYAPALQAFIDDPAQPRFTAQVDALGGPGAAVWVLVGAMLAYVLVRLINAWRATLILDRGAGVVTVIRSPALWPPRRSSLPLAEVGGVRARTGGIFLLFAYLPTITFELVTKDDRVVFKRRMTAGKKAQQEIGQDIDAVATFLKT